MATASNFKSLVDLVRFRATETPSNTAYIFLRDGQYEEQRISYAELDRNARAISVALREQMPAGSCVLINHPPGIDYINAFFGCLYGGIIAVPVYPPRMNQNGDRLDSIIADVKPQAALTSESVLEGIRSNANPKLAELDWFAVPELLGTDADAWKDPRISEETLAFLQYTSGSTSQPKGVMLSHGNLLANLEAISAKFEASTESLGVVWLPPYHDMGLIGGLLTPLYNQFPVVLMSPYTFLQRPHRWLEAISKYKATVSGGPNFAYDLCCRRITDEQLATLDLSSWNLAFCGAEPIRTEALEAFADRFAPAGFKKEALYACYGLAESTLMLSGSALGEGIQTRSVAIAPLEKTGQVLSQPGQPSRKFVGCGTVCDRHAIRIVNPQTGVIQPDNQVGEIWFRGPSVAQGYWKKPEQTEQTFRARANDGELYLRTGDLGFLSNGELYITGRMKDLIVIRGRNLHPQDIEGSIDRCHPSLKPSSAAVFSVDANNEEQIVVVQEVDRRAKDVDLNAIAKTIQERIVEHHGLNPYAICLVKANSIPLTSSGKIQRQLSRKLFLNNEFPELGRFIDGN